MNDLSVYDGVLLAKNFQVKLMELAKSARLRPFQPEQWTNGIKLDGLRQIKHAVFNVGSGDGGGKFGAQSQIIPALGPKNIHLFFNNVSAHANSFGKKLGRLQNGGVYSLKTVKTGATFCYMVNLLIKRLILWKNIMHSARTLEFWFFGHFNN